MAKLRRTRLSRIKFPGQAEISTGTGYDVKCSSSEASAAAGTDAHYWDYANAYGMAERYSYKRLNLQV